MAGTKKLEVDAADGLPISEVGPWAERKHAIIAHYVRITGPSVRAKFAGNTAFVDLYCGPGRARVKETTTIIDGSPVVAWKAASEGVQAVPFGRVLIADKNPDYVEACAVRLVGAPVEKFVGDSIVCARNMLAVLNPNAFTLVLIDPFNLEGLNFEIIELFAALKRVDFIVHFSTMDIQRNIGRYFDATSSPLDTVVPGWRTVIRAQMTNEDKLRAVFEHWKLAIGGLGFKADSDPEAIINSKNRWIYWLACASRHPLAGNFWSKIGKLGPQPGLF